MPCLLTFLFGICIGSFLNVIIWRGPAAWGLAHSAHTEGPPLFGKRSECAKCGEQLKIWHLIPIVSWLILRARCAFCGEHISIRYPLVELAGGITAVLCLWQFGWAAGAIAFAFCCFLIALGMIDLETGYLPDALTLPLIGLGLLINLFEQTAFAPLLDALIGTLVGYGVFWTIRFAYLRMRGMEGLGLGDAKMLAGIGAWFGWAALPFIVLAASLAGLIFAGILLLNGQRIDGRTAIRFGPFLAAGGLFYCLAIWAWLYAGPGSIQLYEIVPI